jgi:uncharacterized protein
LRPCRVRHPVQPPDTLRFALGCPLLVQVGTKDRIAPPDVGRRAAAKAGLRAELREYPVDHLDVYDGPGRDAMLADQIDFARRALDEVSPVMRRGAM